MPTTQLSDLGFYGDDKSEFIYSFFKHFNINANNFNPDIYIEPERSFLSPISGIMLLFNKKQNSVKEITIDKIISAMERQEWID